jgi:hypothetical protein
MATLNRSPTGPAAAPAPNPEARKAMDSLFKRLVEAGGSDLHLGAGKVQIVSSLQSRGIDTSFVE